MLISRTLSSLNTPLPLDIGQGTAITIGNFDGVHMGHHALLSLTRKRAAETGTLPVAITFDPHPMEVLTPNAPPRLTSCQSRMAMLEAAGMDLVIKIEFTKEVAGMDPEAFVRVLLDRLNMKELLLGYDFTLGKGRTGTPEVLKGIGLREGFAVEQLAAFNIHDCTVSSTRIRNLLLEGNVREAGIMLGRLHYLQGEIIHGQNRGGRLLGYPTANLAPSEIMLPKPGVYATLATPFPGQPSPLPKTVQYPQTGTWPAVTNVGYNPTFGPGALTIETHLLDFSGNIYGQQLEVAFVERLRGEVTFSGPDALVAQINKDAEKARNILAKFHMGK